MFILLAISLLAAPAADRFEADLHAVLQKFGGDPGGVPREFKDEVRRSRDALLARKDLPQILERKERFWPVITQALASHGLPEEFGCMVLAESHFDPQAHSERSAGLWQFTAETARRFGLRVDASVDERLDAAKSSQAAAAYLASLVAEFGPESFLLALAGYNAGETAVRRGVAEVARRKGGLRNAVHDYWDLYRLGLLDAEGRAYVPRVIAAALVAGPG